MQYMTAKTLADLLLQQSREQNEILKKVKCDEPHAEFVKIRKMIGATMAAIYLDALHPIFEEHPTLKPIELRRTE